MSTPQRLHEQEDKEMNRPACPPTSSWKSRDLLGILEVDRRIHASPPSPGSRMSKNPVSQTANVSYDRSSPHKHSCHDSGSSTAATCMAVRPPSTSAFLLGYDHAPTWA